MILQENSRNQVLRTRQWIGTDTDRMAALMALFFENDPELTKRIAWVLGHVGEQHPALLEPYLPLLIQQLQQPLPDATKRNILRLLQFADIPEAQAGILADACFRFLALPEEPVAIKSFSMVLLHGMCKTMPDLGNELRLLIEDQLEHASPGFLSRARKVLADIQ